MKLPDFKTDYREARRAAFGQSIARLQQESSAAATVLLKIMLDQNAPASTGVRAATCVINHSTKAIEVEDIGFGHRRFACGNLQANGIPR